ncbi:hypothetical protein Tco_0175378 [Tanacetum coccineum]
MWGGLSLSRITNVSLTLLWVESSDNEESLGEDHPNSTAGDATTVSVATTTTATITTVDDITLAQALMEIKNALKLQAEFDEEEILTREKAEKGKEANIALIETWDDIHAKIDADRQLSERLQAQEQEELSVEENATLFQQLLEKRIKHFAAKRAEEKRNKPPTKA